ncbi:MAG: EthD family reductase [Saprospiraceae bacterium]|nr:EthD family reductase [Saprospiraceae bacterium]
MISVSIFYPNTKESLFNLEYYVTQHIPMVERLLKPMGMEEVLIDEAIGTPMPEVPAPYSVIAHLVFKNYEEMEMCMGHYGEDLMKDVPNFTNVKPLVQISRRV